VLEEIEMFAPADRRDEKVDVVELGRVGLDERARQEIGLLLVVAFERDAVAGLDDGFERRDDVAAFQDLSVGIGGYGLQPFQLVVATGGPGALQRSKYLIIHNGILGH